MEKVNDVSWQYVVFHMKLHSLVNLIVTMNFSSHSIAFFSRNEDLVSKPSMNVKVLAHITRKLLAYQPPTLSYPF